MECSKCHYVNKPGTKFCVKCGNKLADNNFTEKVGADAHQAEEKIVKQTSEVSDNAHDFFEFFKNSLKKPMTMSLPNDKKMGYISLVIYLVLAWLSVFSFGKKITDTVAGATGGFSHVADPVSSQITNNLGFAVLITLVVTWILGWAVSSLLMNSKKSLADYTLEYSRFLNVGSVLFILSIILIFICPLNLLYLGTAIFAIACTLSTFALTYTVLTAKNNASFDALYSLLIAYVLGMIVTSLTLQSVVGNLIQTFARIFNF